VLLAVVDAEGRFVMVDVGAAGRNSDSSLFISSTIRQSFESGASQVPADSDLGELESIPYFLLGDGGLAMAPYLVKPFNDAEARNNLERIHLNTCLSR